MRVLGRLVALAAVAVLAGCGTDVTKSTSSAAPPEAALLRVAINDGKVTPRGARVNLKVGQPLTLSVRSDTAEEIHVHTDPEREFQVRPGKTQRFTFTVKRPGKVAVEVHRLDAVIAEVLVRQ